MLNSDDDDDVLRGDFCTTLEAGDRLGTAADAFCATFAVETFLGKVVDDDGLGEDVEPPAFCGDIFAGGKAPVFPTAFFIL